MRTAILALFVSLGLISVLALGSFFGYDFRVPSAKKAAVPAQVVRPTGGAVGSAPSPVVVPSGTFQGPTENPTVRGPSGPPPQE